jgi:hypothetical protein
MYEYDPTLNTIEYNDGVVRVSSLFCNNPYRETVVYCQSRLRYCYRATVIRTERISFIQHSLISFLVARLKSIRNSR